MMRSTGHRRALQAATSAVLVVAGLAAGVGPAAAAPPTLTVTNDQTVFLHGDVAVTVTSSAPSVGWVLRTMYGGTVLSGNGTVSAGTAVLDLGAAPVGWYRLEVHTNSTEVATVQGSIAVIDPLPAAQRGSVLGVGLQAVAGTKPAQFTAMNRVGFGQVRLQIPWNNIETSQGAYSFPAGLDDGVTAIRAAGARPLLLVGKENKLYNGGHTPSSAADLAAFANYTKAVIGHYGPAGMDVEIDNEFMVPDSNSGSCGPTPACFQQMIDAVHTAVDPVYPQVPLSAAGVQPHTTNTVDLTTLDATITHQYTYPSNPEGGMRSNFEQFRDLIRSKPGGTGIGLWVTEYGWPTPHAEGQTDNTTVTEDQQADYLVRAAVMGLASGMDRVYVYDMVDDGYDQRNGNVPVYNKEHHFGLMALPVGGFAGITPKPALVTQAVLIREIGGQAYVGRSDGDATTYAYRFGTGTTNTRALWTTAAAGTQVDVHTSGPVTLTDRFGATSTLTPSSGTVRVTLSGHPQYVTGPITGVTQA
jgi:hypothetical protein